MSKQYSILDDVIDDETSWYYYQAIDDCWNLIKGDWLGSCRDKYFKYVDQKRVMITGGAHVGMYTRFYAKQFELVYAFEPDPFHFFCLVNNVPNESVIKIQAALGYNRRLISLYQSGGNGHLTLSVNSDTNSVGTIPTLRIDDLALPVCDLIQLDIEYQEYQALLGAHDTIERCHPVIIAENGDTPEIVDYLQSMKYNVIDKTSYDTIWKWRE